MKSLSQKRADFALEIVLKSFTNNKSKEMKKEFKSFAAGTPAMILQNGFGLSMAFLLAKRDEKYKEVYKAVKEWVTKKCELTKGLFTQENIGEEVFIQALNKMEQREYLAVQDEAVKILEWIKRYAAAFTEE